MRQGTPPRPGRAPRQAAGGSPAPGTDARRHRLVARLAQHAQLAAAAARGGRRGRAHGLGRRRVGANVGRQGRAAGAAGAAAAPAAARRCQRLRQHAARHALHGLRGHDQADASENLPCPHPVRDALPGAGADPVAQPLSAMLTATDRPLLLDLWILLWVHTRHRALSPRATLLHNRERRPRQRRARGLCAPRRRRARRGRWQTGRQGRARTWLAS